MSFTARRTYIFNGLKIVFSVGWKIKINARVSIKYLYTS